MGKSERKRFNYETSYISTEDTCLGAKPVRYFGSSNTYNRPTAVKWFDFLRG